MGIKLTIILSVIICCQGCLTLNQKIHRVENGLRTEWKSFFPKKKNILQQMEYHNVPGVCIAVINDFKLEWVKGYGVIETGTTTPVTSNTLFQSGSIGKSVVAATTLKLVEDDRLEMDTNVNDILKSWLIPENSFTERADVTVRDLLSHCAGVSLPGVIGYIQGDSLPDLSQILNGQYPANTPPIHVDRVPGNTYSYSGGGYMIIQQLLVDLFNSDKSFPGIVGEAVFTPLEMNSSTFDYVPNTSSENVASGHRKNGETVQGKYYNYPEMGMGVFWTTPGDMSKFISELMLAYNSESDKILSPEMTRTMLTRHINDQGLGLKLGDDGKDRFYFYHRGGVEGYQTFIIGYPKRGQGAVIMTNSDNGYLLIQEILKSLSYTYKWVGGIYF